MTTDDLQLIEQKLRITLPDNYKELMEAYTFPSDSFTAKFVLMNRVENLLAAVASDCLPPHSFCIGDDGQATSYFIDLTRLDSPVFAHDRRLDVIYEQAANLREFAHKCWETEQVLAGKKC